MGETGGARARLIDVQPQLFVSDLALALQFYTGRLGFAVAFSWGDPPFYAQIVRDAVRLNLRHVDRPHFDRQIARREQLLAACIAVDDVRALYRDCRAAGLELVQELTLQPWGARDFILADIDGNLLQFAGSAG